VTNIVVGYVRAPGAAATTFVLAVSGTTNFIPLQQPVSYTPAQNVFAGQSAVFVVSNYVGTLPNYYWQVTDGATFTNYLSNGPTGTGSTIYGATTPTLTVSNVGPLDVGTYMCLLTNAAPSGVDSPFAVLTLRSAKGTNVVQPSDTISDFYGGTFNGSGIYLGGGTPGEAFASPAGLTVNYIIDGTDEQYLNYGASGGDTSFTGPIGFMVRPSSGSSFVNALKLIVPVNAAVCDPADLALDGSVDGIHWTNIIPDTLLALPNERNLVQTAPVNVTNQVLQEVDFTNNTTNFSYYRVTVQNTKGGSAYNSVQIGEIQFIGSQALVPPVFYIQPTPPVVNLQSGGSAAWNVQASGPGPITYQWYVVSNAVTNLIQGATATNYSATHLTASVAYFCTASNIYGSAASSNAVVNILSPTSTYISTIVADSPFAFFRLDEGPNNPPNDGVVAFDTMGGHNGVYSNTVLDFTPGYSTNDTDDVAAEFGTLPDPAEPGVPVDNYVTAINGVNFYAPSNSDSSLSVEAWVYLNDNVLAGAAVVAKGYGNGGEEFALDMGGTDNDFRFYYRNFGALANGNVSPNVAPPLNTWIHVVGVLSQSNNVTYEYLYTNGLLGASSQVVYAAPPGLNSNDVAPVTIGARQSAGIGTDFNLQLNGAIANVAIYKYALTSNQVLNHYLASGIAPTFIVAPTNLTVPDGSPLPAVFYSLALGTSNSTTAMVYRWQYGGVNLTNGPLPSGTGAIASGVNTPDLTITGYTIGDNGDNFTVTVTNLYGSNSASATLSVVSGPPVIFLDVPPTSELFAGEPFILPTVWVGTEPFTYQWTLNGVPLSNGPRISGATNAVLTIYPAWLSDSGTYQLLVSNAVGNSSSSQDVLTVLPTLQFNGFGAGWSSNSTGITSPVYPSSGTLELTDGNGNEARSSFFSNAVYIGAFNASFTYTDVNGDGDNADGMCFVVQNQGPTALGTAGGGLGYEGITPSVALQFNIYPGNSFGGVGIAFGEDGAIGEVVSPGDVTIDTGDPIGVNVTYLNGVLTVFLQDSNTPADTYTASVALNLTNLIGTNMAYVGFTGADGGVSSVQTIANFQYTPVPTLSIAASNSNIIVSWPTGTGQYELKWSTNLNLPIDDWDPITTLPNSSSTTSNLYNITTICNTVPSNLNPQTGVYLTAQMVTFAVPNTISALTCTIVSGNGPFAPNGSFMITTSGADYVVTPISGPVPPGSGTYTYSVTSGTTASAAVVDNADGPGELILNFTSPTNGTYVITFEAAPGASETGTFVIP
jgi:hypothetical protein